MKITILQTVKGNCLRLSSEEDVPSEHGGDAWDLFLFMHDGIARCVGLEVKSDFSGYAGQVGEEIPSRAVSLEHVTESLKKRQKF